MQIWWILLLYLSPQPFKFKLPQIYCCCKDSEYSHLPESIICLFKVALIFLGKNTILMKCFF